MRFPAKQLFKDSARFTAVLMTLAALTVPAAAEYDRDGVTLFQGVHFRGQNETFYDDVRNLRRTYFGNDCASSVSVPRGCRVTLYRDANFRGASITIGHNVADLGASWIGNNELSSLRIDCYGGHGKRYDDRRYDDRRYDDRGYDDYDYKDRRYDDRRYDDRRSRSRGVTVFSDADFRGRYESFDRDDADLRNNSIRQDTISSVSVAPGCRAVLYADVGFRGAATVLTGDQANLRYSTVGNDRVSSIRVDCRGWR